MITNLRMELFEALHVTGSWRHVATRYLAVRVRDVVCVVVAGAGCRHGAGAVSRVSHQVGDWSELAAVLRTHTQHSRTQIADTHSG